MFLPGLEVPQGRVTSSVCDRFTTGVIYVLMAKLVTIQVYKCYGTFVYIFLQVTLKKENEVTKLTPGESTTDTSSIYWGRRLVLSRSPSGLQR